MKNKIFLLLILLSFIGVAFALSVMPDNSLVDTIKPIVPVVDQNKPVEPIVLPQDNNVQPKAPLVDYSLLIVGGIILLLIILGLFFTIKNKKNRL